MLCCDGFSKFLGILNSSENTYDVAGRALDEVSELLGIGKVTSHFYLPPTVTTPQGSESLTTLYDRVGTVPGEPSYEKSYRTMEGAAVNYNVWPLGRVTMWTEEELKDIDTVLDLIFMHNGRFRLISKMKQVAMTNYLTGLPNSGGLMARLRNYYDEGILLKYNGFCFNLRSFGLINRKFGQREGDSIIKRYAAFLQSIMEPGEILSHFGGDNFAALILKDRTEEFLNILGGTIIYGNMDGKRVPVRIEAVAGVLEIDSTLQNPRQILEQCTLAMQVAKNTLSKPYFFATEEMKTRAFREKRISAHFREAIRDEEFQIYYQPKVDTCTYKVVGAEALVRWFWDGRIVPPADFIPLVEREGSVTDLDLYMLEHACRDIADWCARGLDPVTVSVNFSRRDISDPLLAQKVMNIINNSGIDRKYIQIEVTETTSEDECAKLIGFLNLMNSLGIETAIDDFGSGYSSLNTLRNFAVNVIKIDRSFIANDSITIKDEIVLHNIIDMARELKIDVITEGVEHWDQLQLLKKVGCYTIQGFLFDRPMPKEEFEKRLERKIYDPAKIKDA